MDQLLDGDERGWTTQQLEAWLVAADEGFTSGVGWDWGAAPVLTGRPREELLEQVTSRLDEMFCAFKPNYVVPLDGLNATRLPLWAPRPDVCGAKAFWEAVRPEGATATPLQRSFNVMRAPHEWVAMEFGTRGYPCGRHPLDDYRHDCACVVKIFDQDPARAFQIQDTNEQPHCMLSVRDVRLLLPGAHLKAGSKVVVVRGFTSNASSGLSTVGSGGSDQLCGCLGEVAGVASVQRGAPQFNVRILEGQMDEEVVPLPASRLMAVLENPTFLAGEDTVVLHGLVNRPDLNGQVGFVVRQAGGDNGHRGAAGSGQNEERYEVRLMDWSRGVGAGVLNITSHAEATAAPSIRVRPANMRPVEDPPPCVLVAFAAHSPGSKAMETVLDREMLKLEGQRAMRQQITCTPRELEMLLRALNASSDTMVPLSDADRKKLLGPLDPKLWKVGVLAPTKPPLPKAALVRKELEQLLGCRVCGKSDGKLLRCQACNGVEYCSRECQAADWKARHKQECKGSAQQRKGRQGTAGRTAGSTTSAGGRATAALSGDETVLLDILHSGNDEAGGGMLDFRSGMVLDLAKLPGNLHGDAEFVMKLQNAVDPQITMGIKPATHKNLFALNFMLYDQPRSLNVHVHPQRCPQEHAALVKILKAHGQKGIMTPHGRKAYVYARREGKDVRVVTSRLPPQEQRW